VEVENALLAGASVQERRSSEAIVAGCVQRGVCSRSRCWEAGRMGECRGVRAVYSAVLSMRFASCLAVLQLGSEVALRKKRPEGHMTRAVSAV